MTKNVEKGALEWANSQNWEKGALEWAICKMGERCIRSAKKAKCISARMLRALENIVNCSILKTLLPQPGLYKSIIIYLSKWHHKAEVDFPDINSSVIVSFCKIFREKTAQNGNWATEIFYD